MAKIKITQTKSRINCPAVQKRTLDSLGLRKMHKTVEYEFTPSVLGMIKAVSHLVTTEPDWREMQKTLK